MSQPPRVIPLQGVAAAPVGGSGLLPIGLLCPLVVTAGGLTFLCRGAPVSGDITEALFHRAFVDFGGTLVSGGSLILAPQLPVAGVLVAHVGLLGALAGTLCVCRGDRLAGGKFLPTVQQLLGTPGRVLTRCVGHYKTVDPPATNRRVVLDRCLRVG